jgi:hypothetical protein
MRRLAASTRTTRPTLAGGLADEASPLHPNTMVLGAIWIGAVPAPGTT